MSAFTSGGIPGGGEPSPGTETPPGVFESLLALLDDLFSAPEHCPTPEKGIVYPKKAVQDAYASVYCAIIGLGVWPLVAKTVATLVAALFFAAGVGSGVVLWAIEAVGPALAEGVLNIIDKARKDLDPVVAEIAVLALNELLGTELEASMLASGTDVASHIARAEQVGGLLHNQFLAEFGGKTALAPEDGVRAGKRFSGFLINFGTATAFLSLFGELLTFGQIEAFRELGVEVAQNLGLGRLHRMVMKPLIQTLIGIPYQWSLNRTFHPTQFRVADLVNPFTGAVMDKKDVFDAMDLAGYTEDKALKLIQLHQRKLTETDVEALVRWKFWTRDDGIKYFRQLGFPDPIAETVFTALELRRGDLRIKALVDSIEANFVDGHMSVEVLRETLDPLPLSDAEKQLIQLTAIFKQRAPHKKLTLVEMQQAFDQGLVTLSELETFLLLQGFSRDDQSILLQLTLLKFAHIQEAEAAKKKRAEDRAAATAAKAARPPKPSKKP